jgi:hypothetical protein
MTRDLLHTDDPESLGLMGTTDAIFFSGLSAAVLRRYEKDQLIRPTEDREGTRYDRHGNIGAHLAPRDQTKRPPRGNF